MRQSDFQFTDPSLINIRFLENEDFIKEKGEDIEITTKIDIKNKLLSDHEAIVSVLIKIGFEKNSPFNLECEVAANFRWNQEIKEENVEFFLNQNAPALLVSYARPIISMITNSSHFPVYNLPFINFVEDKK